MEDALAKEIEIRRILGEPLAVTGMDHATMSCSCESCKRRRLVVERVLAERERCAKVCEATHAELDTKYGPDGCTDTALIAAERIREGK